MFEELGTQDEEYEIKLKPDAVLYSLFRCCHVPLPMRTKVTEELAHMEAMGVISKVDQPKPWCIGMVVVLKSPDLSGFAWT